MMTNTEITQREAEIKARLEATTPGEWVYKETPRGQYAVWAGDIIVMGDYGGSIPPSSSDAEFCAHAKPDMEWLLEWIKELEAEVTNGRERYARCRQAGEEWHKRARALEDNARDNHSRITALEKWSRRWKRATIAKENKICALNLTQAVFSIALMRRDERIAALENAARSCATCLYHVSDLEPIPDYCNANCRKPDIRGAGWAFDEKRFAAKGTPAND